MFFIHFLQLFPLQIFETSLEFYAKSFPRTKLMFSWRFGIFTLVPWITISSIDWDQVPIMQTIEVCRWITGLTRICGFDHQHAEWLKQFGTQTLSLCLTARLVRRLKTSADPQFGVCSAEPDQMKINKKDLLCKLGLRAWQWSWNFQFSSSPQLLATAPALFSNRAKTIEYFYAVVPASEE